MERKYRQMIQKIKQVHRQMRKEYGERDDKECGQCLLFVETGVCLLNDYTISARSWDKACGKWCKKSGRSSILAKVPMLFGMGKTDDEVLAKLNLCRSQVHQVRKAYKEFKEQS